MHPVRQSFRPCAARRMSPTVIDSGSCANVGSKLITTLGVAAVANPPVPTRAITPAARDKMPRNPFDPVTPIIVVLRIVVPSPHRLELQRRRA